MWRDVDWQAREWGRQDREAAEAEEREHAEWVAGHPALITEADFRPEEWGGDLEGQSAYARRTADCQPSSDPWNRW
jgi:hypothetical protein